MKRIRRVLTVVALGTATACLVTSRSAEAHWCHDLWNSGYNIVVRVDADTITVPSSGSGTVDVRVQNNMGYPLKDFRLSVVGSGFTASVKRMTEKKTGFLLPGESAKYTVTITKSGGGTLQASALNFYVQFGGQGQSAEYSDYPGTATQSGRRPVMIKTPTGLVPQQATGVESGHDQAYHLNYAAQADFGDTAAGLDNLIQTYCAGRGSWSQTDGKTNAANCSSPSATQCPVSGDPGFKRLQSTTATKWDFDRLWAATELAARKPGLGAKADVVRARLKCGAPDAHLAFGGMAHMALGYLGENADARAFLENSIASGASNEIKAIAKAALTLMGKADDKTKYEADIRAGASNANKFVAASSAAALGIAWKDDAAVESVLVKLADWVEPDSDSGLGIGFYAAHLLELTAWDRRGWAADAADTAIPSFYPGAGTTTPPDPPTDGGTTQPPASTPAVPGNVQCSVATDGKAIHVSWDAVTKNTAGTAITATYKLYYGNTARPATVMQVGQGGFDYAHVNSVSTTSSDLTDVAGKEYIAVTAITGGVASPYSTEVTCTSTATNPDPQGGTGGGTPNPNPSSGSGGGSGTPSGSAGSGPTGTPGTAGTSLGTAGSTGNNPNSDGGTPPEPPAKGGCSVTSTSAGGIGSLLLALAVGIAARLRRRRAS